MARLGIVDYWMQFIGQNCGDWENLMKFTNFLIITNSFFGNCIDYEQIGGIFKAKNNGKSGKQSTLVIMIKSKPLYANNLMTVGGCGGGGGGGGAGGGGGGHAKLIVSQSYNAFKGVPTGTSNTGQPVVLPTSASAVPLLQSSSHQPASKQKAKTTKGRQINPKNDQQQQQVQQQTQQQQQLPKQPIKILVNHNRINNHMPPPDASVVPIIESQLVHKHSKYEIQYELQDTWTFWYLRLEKNFSWEHSQIDLGTFSTVETFWGIFDNVLPLTEAHHGCNYSVFKKGIRPIWEDPMNRHGGRFVFTINKEDRNFKEFADRMWLEFAMAIVGNIMPELCDQICGIVGGNRNNLIKIALWTRDCEKLDDIVKIGKPHTP